MGYTDRLTELEATNVILSSAGLSAVDSVSPAPALTTDEGVAYSTLVESAKSLNARGWSWNSEYDVELTPADPTPGTITVTADVVSVRNLQGEKQVALRGLTLYDLEDNTDQFTESVRADIIRLLAWDDMPEEARWAAVYIAAEAFLLRSYPGSDEINRVRAEKDTRMQQLLARDSEMAQDNLYHNYDVAKAFMRPGLLGF